MSDHEKPRVTASSTELLIASASGGDAGARGRLLARYDAFVRSLVRRHLGVVRFREEGEDLLQTIHLSIAQSMGKVRARDGAAFAAWLKRLVQCRTMDWERLRARERKRPDGTPLRLDGTWGAMVAAATPTPSLILLRKETRERLSRAIETVPSRYRRLLRFLCEEDPKPREVALFLGKPKEAARKVVARALTYLRQALEATDGTKGP